MMKKGLLLLLLLPFAAGLDCITYLDCPERDCIGSARICYQGSCVQTECVQAGTGHAYYKQFGAAFDVTGIASLVMRLILFGALAVIVSLMFPLLKLEKKAKAAAGILLAILMIAAGFYLFGSADVIHRILGSHDDWKSNAADSIVMPVANELRLELDERVLAGLSKEFAGGKEYKIRGEDELSLVILEKKMATAQESLSLAGLEARAVEIKGRSMLAFDGSLQRTYAWQDTALLLILSGESGPADNLLARLLDPPQAAPDEPMPAGPEIVLLLPASDITRDRDVWFQARGAESVTVSGIGGFESHSCENLNTLHNCSFLAHYRPGRNSFAIQAVGLGGGVSKKELDVLFDNETWSLVPVYPKDGAYINTPSVHFLVQDMHSGLGHGSFSLAGIDASLDRCSKSQHAFECEFLGLVLPEGMVTVAITGSDNAGNHGRAELSFIYDKTRPEISITDKGFMVSDNIALKEDSLMLDGRRYSLDNCRLISGAYHCPHPTRISAVSAMDRAGNHAAAENRLTR